MVPSPLPLEPLTISTKYGTCVTVHAQVACTEMFRVVAAGEAPTADGTMRAQSADRRGAMQRASRNRRILSISLQDADRDRLLLRHGTAIRRPHRWRRG